MSDKIVLYYTSGGPAPGMNNVTRSMTLGLIDAGFKVFGFHRGLSEVRKGNIEGLITLNRRRVERIAKRGGSILKNARASLRDDEHLQATIDAILRIESNQNGQVVAVVGNGGNDTFESTNRLKTGFAERNLERIKVLHAAKTIDNDLWLPTDSSSPFALAPEVEIEGIPSYGYSTAVESMGQRVVSSLFDAETTGKRVFIVETMGRRPGWMAYGTREVAQSMYGEIVGRRAKPPITITREVLEKMGVNEENRISLERLAEICANTLRTRLSDGDTVDDVIIVSEGVKELLDDKSAEVLAACAEKKLKDIERDEFGHLQLSGLPFAAPLAKRVESLLNVGARALVMGYGTRCLPPNVYDAHATSAIGRTLVRLVEEEKTEVTVFSQGGVGAYSNFTEVAEVDSHLMKERLLPSNVVEKLYRELSL